MTTSPLAAHQSTTDRRGRSGRIRFSVSPRRYPELPEVDGLLAGAALVDITPPPGLPKAGYSANAHTGNGFHTRLRAAVTHLRSGRSSVALVQLDLLGGSPILQHLVAEAVADETDIPLAGIWMGATHTHAGPGQFLGSDFYNQHASNKAGFDPAWTQFLVDRIAGGIIDAHRTRGPARAAFGTCEVWGLTRNRSHDPHTHNRTVTDKRQDPQRKWVTVNPELHLLRVDRVVGEGGAGADTEPLAAAVVFSIHGTGVSMKAKEYNADLWAYLKGELGDRIEADAGTRPVVGAMEGTHADVAPALRPSLAGHREARRIGTGIGAEAFELYAALGASLTDDVPLDVGLREIDLDRVRAVDGIELPDRPAVGAALVAGAKENLTPVINRIPPFRAGTPKRWGRANPQAEKWVIGSRWLQPLMLPKRGFPRVLPLQVVRVADRVLVGLPFETTVESGRRVAAAVADALAVSGSSGSSDEPGPIGTPAVVVSSVVNDYWGYVATAEEYARQFYEGGHTLYGPNTQAFVAAHAARLAADTVGRAVCTDVCPQRSWDLTARRFLPSAGPSAPSGPDRSFERVARFTDPTATTDGFWEQTWLDVAPGDLHWHEPLVRVEASDDDGRTWTPALDHGRRVDDQGWTLAVTHLGAETDDPSAGVTGHRYRVRWYEPVLRFGRRHRFVLVANAGRPEVAGRPFD
jgi:neutral ceramidase